jgi:hypothetical protein
MDLDKIIVGLMFIGFIFVCISLWLDYFIIAILFSQIIVVGLIVRVQLMIKNLGKR